MTERPPSPEESKSSDDFAPLSLLISRIRAQQVMGFQMIAKHTRMVATAKWGMGALALILLALLVVLPMTVPKEAAMRLAFSNISTGDTDKPAMINPRFEGLNEDNQPFTVMAKRAIQRNDELIDLENLQADLGLSGGTRWVNMTARTGVYDRSLKYLWLRNDVNLFFDDGTEVHTEECDIDISRGIAQGVNEVTMTNPTATLRADRYRIEQKHKRAFFTGNVRMVLYLDEKK